MKRRMLTAMTVAALAVTGLMSTSVCQAERSLTIKGSDTIVILAQAWAEAFMGKHKDVNISVQGGGSGTGISALINGTTDIANASRYMKKKEIDKCRQKNIVPTATAVALDGVSFAVNSANPVKSLSIDQLKGIYTGKITNWKQVGGNNAPIVVLSRENSSGTYAYVQERVNGGLNYSEKALMMPSTKAIQAEITNNKNAIGYGGEAYFKGKRNVKVLPIAAKSGQTAVYPTEDNIRSSKYPLSRPLLVYTAGRPSGLIADYINFCLSPEGQKIVEKVGYVAIKK